MWGFLSPLNAGLFYWINMKKSAGNKKVVKVMKEFKAGTLNSGKDGKVVKNPKQAIAIALSQAKMSKPKKK